jgi:hypothetical protein
MFILLSEAVCSEAVLLFDSHPLQAAMIKVIVRNMDRVRLINFLPPFE